jgi:hypothetical protein
LGWLDNGSAQLLSLSQRGRDVLDRDEEQHFVLASLARADRDRRAILRLRVDERVAREPTLRGNLPAE